MAIYTCPYCEEQVASLVFHGCDSGKVGAKIETLQAQNAELVAALSQCVAELQDWVKSHGEDLKTATAIKNAQEAIARATGKESETI